MFFRNFDLYCMINPACELLAGHRAQNSLSCIQGSCHVFFSIVKDIGKSATLFRSRRLL